MRGAGHLAHAQAFRLHMGSGVVPVSLLAAHSSGSADKCHADLRAREAPSMQRLRAAPNACRRSVVARTWWSRAMMQVQPTTTARILQPQLLHPDRPHAAVTATPALQSHVIVYVCSEYWMVFWLRCIPRNRSFALGYLSKYSSSLVVVLVDSTARSPSLPPSSSLRGRCLPCRRNTARCPSHV